MLNRAIFLLVVASAVSIFALWLVWKDGSHYVAMATRDDTTADTTLTARPIGRAEFVKVDSFDVTGEGLSSEKVFLTQKNVLWIFTDCIPDTGDLLYPARVNDSLFVMVWLNPDLVKRSGIFSQ